MPTFGLGNFLYDLEVKDGKANFHFYDDEDADNTADVTLSAKDFNGFDATSRQVADIAYAQAAKVLNDKRDARLAKQAQKDLAAKQTEDARSREAQADFTNNAKDVAVEPAQVEEDGTHVYNTDNAQAATKTDADASDDKKSK